MNVLAERVAALERIQQDLKDEMSMHFKNVMDCLGKMVGSVVSGSKDSSAAVVVSKPTQSDPSPIKGKVFVSVSSDTEGLEEDKSIEDNNSPSGSAQDHLNTSDHGERSHIEHGEDKGHLQVQGVMSMSDAILDFLPFTWSFILEAA